jgi:O-antigen/teichoic acid export membrane protein
MIKRLLSKDTHLGEVLRGAALAFILRGFGAGLAFLLNAMVARMLGAEGAGLYFLALSVTMIAAVIARLGLDNALLRFVAVHASRDEWGLVKGVFAQGMRMALISSALLTLLCLVLAPWLADYVFNKPDLGMPLRWMSLGIMSFSMMMLMSECLKGMRRIRNAMLVSGVLYPLIALLLVWPLVTLFGVGGANAAYVLGTGGAAVVGLIFWRRAMASHAVPPVSIPRDQLRASSRPLFVMSLLNGAVLSWAPLLLLGIWGSTEESGIFGAATRLAMLLTFFLNAVNTVAAPKFAALYQKGEIEILGRIASRTALLITMAASPLFVIFFVAGDWVMSVFGHGFSVGGRVLAILTLGQVVNSFTGSVGFLLAMTGNERSVRNSAIMGASVLIVLAVILIPFYGMTGAAIAASMGLMVDKTSAAWFAWKKLGILGVALPRFLSRRI